MLREATRRDLPVLRAVERAAGVPFRDVGMALVADDEPLSLEELSVFKDDGRAWVVTDASDVAVAYLLVEIVDDAAHIEQVSVHPAHARQRLGQQLIDRAEAWARERCLASLTLTTFAEVPWNAPYYARLGFEVLSESTIGPGLRRVCREEADHGLARWPRVVMRRIIPTS
ncbi:MAG: GNAT family N-acetyltransferase [Nocardioides sp.]|nr:GNAT family N-acetyltransferase [Nocardioides sp.]